MALAVSLKGMLALFASTSHYDLVIMGDGGDAERRIHLGEYGSSTLRSSDRLEIVMRRRDGRNALIIIATTLRSREYYRELASKIAAHRNGFLLDATIHTARFESLSSPCDVIDGEVVEVVLPDGVTLDRYLLDATAEDLGSIYRALRVLEGELLESKIGFKRLTPNSIVVGEDGRLYPFNLDSLRFGFEGGADACSTLRDLLCEEYGAERDETDVEPDADAHYPDRYDSCVDGYLWSGELHEDRIVVEAVEGFGYVDALHRVVIAPQYIYAESFEEGRAVVQGERGWGLIDLWGNEVIAAEYDTIGYDPQSGVTTVRRGSEWRYFSYIGEALSECAEVAIDEDSCKVR